MFSDQLGDWAPFAGLLGAAAATLMGLLFVAVSLNSRAVMEPRDEESRLMAINTFSGFLFLLIYALFMLIPNQSPASLGWSFIIATLFHFRVIAEEALRAWRAPGGGSLIRVLWRQGLPLVSAVLIVVVGILLVGGWSTDLDLLLYAFFSLLIGSTLNSWFLLLRFGTPDVKL